MFARTSPAKIKGVIKDQNFMLYIIKPCNNIGYSEGLYYKYTEILGWLLKHSIFSYNPELRVFIG